MFINGMEELGPNEVDNVVEMELVEDYETSPDKSEEVRSSPFSSYIQGWH